MTMKISFELSDNDLNFFRKALKESRRAVRDADESEIIDAVNVVLEEIRKNEPLPDFVSKRIPELESLISMLTDDEWHLPEADRERLLATFIYFADPEDILPDHIPVIGYLDDVIIIELVVRELHHVRTSIQLFDATELIVSDNNCTNACNAAQHNKRKVNSGSQSRINTEPQVNPPPNASIRTN